MKETLTKDISYCYPTSPAAAKLGHGATGCYYLKLGRKLIGAYLTRDAVFAAANQMPQSYDRYSLIP